MQHTRTCVCGAFVDLHAAPIPQKAPLQCVPTKVPLDKDVVSGASQSRRGPPCTPPPAPQVVCLLTALLWFSLSVYELYESLTTRTQMGVGIHQELSTGLWVMAVLLLMFSQLYPWRWAALVTTLGFLSLVVVWIQQGACWRWYCNASHLAAAPWLLNRALLYVVGLLLSYQIERDARREYVPRDSGSVVLWFWSMCPGTGVASCFGSGSVASRSAGSDCQRTPSIARVAAGGHGTATTPVLPLPPSSKSSPSWGEYQRRCTRGVYWAVAWAGSANLEATALLAPTLLPKNCA